MGIRLVVYFQARMRMTRRHNASPIGMSQRGGNSSDQSESRYLSGVNYFFWARSLIVAQQVLDQVAFFGFGQPQRKAAVIVIDDIQERLESPVVEESPL